MKKFSAFFFLIFAMFIFVSCVEDEDEEESSDTVSGDTQPSGDTTPSEPTDTGDTEATPSDPTDTGSSDAGDTGSTDTSDTASSDTGDTGQSDTGDTGSSDTGSPDTGSDTGDSAPVPEPEPEPEPVKCTGFSIDPDSFEYEKVPDEDLYIDMYYADITDILGDESLKDELRIEIKGFNDPQVKPYDLAYPANLLYQTCTECVRIFQDIKENGTPTKQFFQESGTLTIDQIDSESHGIKGSLTVKLVEITIDKDGDSNQVPNGACFEVEGLLFDNIP